MFLVAQKDIRKLIIFKREYPRYLKALTAVCIQPAFIKAAPYRSGTCLPVTGRPGCCATILKPPDKNMC